MGDKYKAATARASALAASATSAYKARAPPTLQRRLSDAAALAVQAVAASKAAAVASKDAASAASAAAAASRQAFAARADAAVAAADAYVDALAASAQATYKERIAPAIRELPSTAKMAYETQLVPTITRLPASARAAFDSRIAPALGELPPGLRRLPATARAAYRDRVVPAIKGLPETIAALSAVLGPAVAARARSLPSDCAALAKGTLRGAQTFAATVLAVGVLVGTYLISEAVTAAVAIKRSASAIRRRGVLASVADAANGARDAAATLTVDGLPPFCARSADVAVLYATIFVGIYKFIIDGAVGGARAVQARAKAQFDAVRSLRGY